MTRDFARASELFRRAEDDQSKSEFALGFLHYHGDTVEKDLALAYALFRCAAAMGHADGQSFLGRTLAEGVDVEPNIAEAWFWFTLAEAQKPSLAAYNFNKYEDALETIHKEAARLRAGLWVPKC